MSERFSGEHDGESFAEKHISEKPSFETNLGSILENIKPEDTPYSPRDFNDVLGSMLYAVCDNKNDDNGKDQKPTEREAANDSVDEKSDVNESKRPNPNEINNDDKPLVNDGEQFDEDGVLKPNIRYRTDDSEGREYIYETDDKGRIVKVTAKNLELTKRDKRLPYDSKTPDKRDTDDAGHLIADRFGGSPKLDNIISQDRDLNQNRGDYADNWYNMEEEWAEAIADGKTVEVEIVVTYDGDSERPSSFEVNYTIDGDVQVKSFDNNPKGANS